LQLGTLRERVGHDVVAAPQPFEQRIEFRKLGVKYRAGQFGDAQVDAGEHRFIPLELMLAGIAADIMVHAGTRKIAVIVGQHRTAFARVQILELVETEGPDVANGTHAPSLVTDADRLAGIFYDKKIVLLRDGGDGVHVADQVQHMHRYDRLGVGRDLALDILGIDRQALVDIDQHRYGADGKRRDRGRYPRIGGHQYLVSRPDAGRNQRRDQCAGTAVDRQSMFDTQQLRELLFKSRREALLAASIAKQLTAGDHASESNEFRDTDLGHIVFRCFDFTINSVLLSI